MSNQQSYIQIIIPIAVFLITMVTAVVAHFRSIGTLKDKIHEIEKEVERLKAKDELQQQVIDQTSRSVDSLIQRLIKALNKKE